MKKILIPLLMLLCIELAHSQVHALLNLGGGSSSDDPMYVYQDTITAKDMAWGKLVRAQVMTEHRNGTKKIIDGQEAWSEVSSVLIACSGKPKNKQIAIEWTYYPDGSRGMGRVIKKDKFNANEDNFDEYARPLANNYEQGLLKLCN